jgi:hypothetical protein
MINEIVFDDIELITDRKLLVFACHFIKTLQKEKYIIIKKKINIDWDTLLSSFDEQDNEPKKRGRKPKIEDNQLLMSFEIENPIAWLLGV